MDILGCEYASLPDTDPAKKENFLQIAQCSHGYLLKYLSLICAGHVPLWGNKVNKDVETFLRFFLPKRSDGSRQALGNTARTLHLAFKTMSADDVYDVLMEHLLTAARRYDPFYTDKVKLITEIIDEELRTKPQFTADEISSHIDFDAAGYLRLLARREFVVEVGKRGSEGTRYARSDNWPPPASFFNSGPIGLAYYLQTWFRYYLQQWIERRMSELETREGVYSLEYGYEVAVRQFDNSTSSAVERNIPDASGDFRDANGRNWAADVSLTNAPLDVSKMTLEWVASTDDSLFSGLTRRERHLLYLVFARDTQWPEIGEMLGVAPRTAKQQFATLRAKLQDRVRDNATVVTRRKTA